MGGVQVMRDAFNQAADGAAICQQAFLDYGRDQQGEYQILTFRGICPGGEPFEVRSEPLRGEIVVADEAAVVARRLIAPPAVDPMPDEGLP